MPDVCASVDGTVQGLLHAERLLATRLTLEGGNGFRVIHLDDVLKLFLIAHERGRQCRRNLRSRRAKCVSCALAAPPHVKGSRQSW
jgi:hypothetical protein